LVIIYACTYLDIHVHNFLGNLAVILLIVLGSSIIGLSKSDALDLTLALPLLEYLFSLGVSSQNLTMTGAALIVGAALLLVKPKVSEPINVFK
jgi:hypothetical protein